MTRSAYPYVERSMHQGTSLRLEQERVASEGQLADAEERLGAGLAPSAEAEDQFRRMRVVWQRRAGEAGGSAAMQDRNTAVAAGLVRTTAEPRPNACVVVLCAWRPLLPIAARALPPTWRICAEAARSPPIFLPLTPTLQLHSERPRDSAAIRWPRTLQAHCRTGTDYGVDASYAKADPARDYFVSAAATPRHPPREVAALDIKNEEKTSRNNNGTQTITNKQE